MDTRTKLAASLFWALAIGTAAYWMISDDIVSVDWLIERLP